MSVAYGLTESGFVPKPATVIKAELEARLKAGPLGASAGTEADGSIPAASIAGQVVAVMVDGLSSLWQQQQEVAASFDPGQATDAALDAVCSITGTVRDRSVASLVTATCTGAPGTPLPASRVARVALIPWGQATAYLLGDRRSAGGNTYQVTTAGTSASSGTGPAGTGNAIADGSVVWAFVASGDGSENGARFDSLADATIALLASWSTATVYALGDRVTANGNCYECNDAGTSSGSGTGPSGTSNAIPDGSAGWAYLGPGTGAVDVAMECEAVGPTGAAAGTLSNIATPISGWQAVTNRLDAEVGSLLESNSALRVKREAELHAQGLAAIDAIRTHMLKVGEGTTNPVTACTVFYNNTDSTDADGMPPHSVEVLVRGGVAADVAQAVWTAVGGGIAMVGTNTTTVTDSEGNPQTVKWSRPTEVPIYVVADVLYDQAAGVFPATGSADLKSAIKTFGDTYSTGRDVRASVLAAAAVDGPTSTDPTATAVPGVLDVSPLYIGTAPAPGASTPITITRRQIATFDTARITINLTPGSP